MKKLRIGFIGNFKVPYTTENDRQWSLEKLGHEVIPFQENGLMVWEDIWTEVMCERIDILIYSHTHGWGIKNLISIFDKCKEKNIPTVSVHLDRWAWLARETDIGKEATWFTEFQFMADFSPEAQELYKKHNLNAYYLRPGVVERDCYMVQPDPVRFPHEIVFVGSRGYHPEYPERTALIEFLEKTYGSRFGHYGGDSKYGTIRGHDLNVLYATSKIAVGDSCFGGRPNYVSDRYYETRGRGGFLLHPKVEGVDYHGVQFYEKDDNFKSLKREIDFMLDNPDIIEKSRQTGHEWVKKHETYSNRAQEMLDIIFNK